MIETLRNFLSDTFVSKQGRPAFERKEEQLLFEERLVQVTVWCSGKMRWDDPRKSLRSDFLKPSLITNNESWNYELTDRTSEVEDLCKKRAAAITNDSQEDLTLEGRLLLFWPDETLSDGAAEQCSKGYFDSENIPPWDTWFWYGPLIDEPPALISWVPHGFVDLADAGISANPEQCLRWLKKV